MSEIIKLNSSRKGIHVNVVDPSTASEPIHSNEDFFQVQLQKQFENGHVKGYDAAINELEKSYSEKIISRFKELHTIAAALQNKIEEQEKHFESIIVQLSVLIAERIIKREIAQKTIINEVIKDALKRIIGANNVIVKLNPNDYSVISAEAGVLMNDSSFTKINFEPDDRIDQGGCYLESEIGNVDSRLSTQLNEVKRALEAVAYVEEPQ